LFKARDWKVDDKEQGSGCMAGVQEAGISETNI
jgi:hypothetical protein